MPTSIAFFLVVWFSIHFNHQRFRSDNKQNSKGRVREFMGRGRENNRR
jgi:hypothetical protein